MAPVEHDSVPTPVPDVSDVPVKSPSDVSLKPLSDMKMVEKALELPLVSDTLSELGKVTHSLSENSSVVTARHMMEDGLRALSDTTAVTGLRALSDTNAVKDSLKAITENSTVNQTMNSMKAAVVPRVADAVDQLDTLACGGIDSLTSALPALTSPTPELVESTKEAARGYFAWAKEYAASFTVAQISLKVADKALQLVERTTGYFRTEDQGTLNTTYRRIRSIRRSLRNLKRSGARVNHVGARANPTGRGIFERITSFLHINLALQALGLELVPEKIVDACKEGEAGEPGDETNTHIRDIQDELVNYNSDEDPDYRPDTSDDSLDESDSSEDEQDGDTPDGEQDEQHRGEQEHPEQHHEEHHEQHNHEQQHHH